MKIIDIKVMRGPNFWSVRYPKLVVMKLDLEELEYRPTNEIEGFAQRIEELIPSLYTHFCSEGHPGGFFERVRAGTWMGHVIEHIALEIQTLAGMDVGFGRTRGTGQEGIYHVVIAYEEETAGFFAARTAVQIAEALISGEPYELEATIQALKQIKKDNYPGPSTASILDEARRRNIPLLTLSPNGLYQLGYGKNGRRIRASMGSTTSCIAVDIAGDKDETKYLLAAQGIPVPTGTLVKNEEELQRTIADIGYPVVVKPLDGHQGKGITVGIRNLQEAREALLAAQEISEQAIVEQCIGGLDFRFLVVDYKFVAASRRTAAAVTGDGHSTIHQLIDQVNSDPCRGGGHESILTVIKIDAITEGILEHRGFTLDTILPEGQILYLKKTANLSTGGTATDVTDEVHPANVRLAERIARIIGLDICGIDITAPAVDTPLLTNKGAVLEVNAAPGLRMHLAPAEGQARNVAAPIVDMLFPEGESSRIPIIAVTGTNGKTTVTRLLAHIIQMAGYYVGFTTTDGIYMGGELVQAGDNTGPISTKMVLSDPEVEFAVLECARGGLLRAGLGFDQCDIGIVTNVAADHLGLGDIHTVEQMAKVKAVIPETVHSKGYAILNADDELVYQMHTRVASKVAYFSLDQHNPRIQEHIQLGGVAALLEDGFITLYMKDTKIQLAKAADIPLTFSGAATYMIANILPAVLACHLHGIGIEIIRSALQTFIPSPEMTPGRLNVFKFNNFQFMVDYAHNAAGLRAVGEFLQKLDAYPKVGIIAGVGDRRDEDITELGSIAAQIFDEIIIRVDRDTRDRTQQELIDLLKKGIHEHYPTKPVQVIPTEAEAITYAVSMAKEGSFIVDCSEKIQEALAVVSRLQEADNKMQQVQV
jgi:cyanophycin synthetase